MSGVNKVILVGHIGEVPGIQLLTNGTKVLSFPLLTTEEHYKGDRMVEHKEWHEIVMSNILAEKAVIALTKGTHVYIDGCVKTRSYIDQHNIRRYLTEIIASGFTIMS